MQPSDSFKLKVLIKAAVFNKHTPLNGRASAGSHVGRSNLPNYETHPNKSLRQIRITFFLLWALLNNNQELGAPLKCSTTKTAEVRRIHFSGKLKNRDFGSSKFAVSKKTFLIVHTWRRPSIISESIYQFVSVAGFERVGCCKKESVFFSRKSQDFSMFSDFQKNSEPFRIEPNKFEKVPSLWLAMLFDKWTVRFWSIGASFDCVRCNSSSAAKRPKIKNLIQTCPELGLS